MADTRFELQADSKAQAQGVALAAVVVTHDRPAKLDVTLDRLRGEPPSCLQAIIVIDNGSQGETTEILSRQAALDPRILVHRSAVNLGGAGGFALGMQMAVDRFDPDWLVVMDDDARPLPGGFRAFAEADHSGWDAVAAAVYFPGGEICEMNRPSRNPFWTWQGLGRLLRFTATGKGRDGFHIPRACYSSDTPVPIDATSFVGFFISRDAVRRIGYPDPRLFIYGDDVLYTLALRERGGRICFDPSIRFEHDFSTIAGGQGRFTPLWKSYYHHRNLLLVYHRAAGLLFWPSLLVVLPKWLLKVRHHPGDRRAYLRLLRKAIWHGLTGRIDVTLAEVQAAAR